MAAVEKPEEPIPGVRFFLPFSLCNSLNYKLFRVSLFKCKKRSFEIGIFKHVDRNEGFKYFIVYLLLDCSLFNETEFFKTATVVGVFAGLLYGGSKEASASVSKDAEVMLQHRLMRDAIEKRFIRVTRGPLIGGMRLGMFTASFFSLQNFLAETRGVHDVFNVVGAGSATAAVFGLIMPGSIAWRARNVMLGSILGATVCFPLGWLQLKLMEKANERKSETIHHGEVTSGVGKTIERLEQQLRK